MKVMQELGKLVASRLGGMIFLMIIGSVHTASAGFFDSLKKAASSVVNAAGSSKTLKSVGKVVKNQVSAGAGNATGVAILSVASGKKVTVGQLTAAAVAPTVKNVKTAAQSMVNKQKAEASKAALKAKADLTKAKVAAKKAGLPVPFATSTDYTVDDSGNCTDKEGNLIYPAGAVTIDTTVCPPLTVILPIPNTDGASVIAGPKDYASFDLEGNALDSKGELVVAGGLFAMDADKSLYDNGSGATAADSTDALGNPVDADGYLLDADGNQVVSAADEGPVVLDPTAQTFYTDSSGNVINPDGSSVTDADGNQVTTDGEGNCLDGNGDPFDPSAAAEPAVDVNGNPVDADGALLDANGEQVVGPDGGPIGALDDGSGNYQDASGTKCDATGKALKKTVVKKTVARR